MENIVTQLTNGNDNFNAGNGNDKIGGLAGNDIILGLAGDDALLGNQGNDRLEGGEGDDTLDGGVGNDQLFGGAGNDVLVGGIGQVRSLRRANRNVLNGGVGNDTADYSRVPGAVNADLAAGTASYAVRRSGFLSLFRRHITVRDQLVSIENLKGGSKNDTLAGNEQANILEGKGGNDTLRGRGGDDTLIGGTGDDQIFGDAGNDRIILNNGDGSDTIRGGLGEDVVEVNGAADAGDNFELRSNRNKVELLRSNLEEFQLDIDDVETIEINGGGGDDRLTIKSLTSTNVQQVKFDGGAGDDVLIFGNIQGDVNVLTLSTPSQPLSDSVFASPDPLTISPNATKPDASGINLPVGIFNPDSAPLLPNGGDDILVGRGEPSIFADGGVGNDRLTGGRGDDTLLGGAGDDILKGEIGDDILSGGSGNNELTGGRGADIFSLSADGFAAIQDFSAAQGDRVQIQQDLLSASLGSIEAVRAALTFDSNSGILAIDGVQLATIQSPAGGFDVNSHVDFV